MAAHDNVVFVDSSGGARSITLPAPTNGRVITIKDSTGSAATNNITVLPAVAELIDGASSKVITANWGEIQLVSNGTDWFTNAPFVASGGSGDISNGGNSFGSAITIGTNDNFGLNFETNGTTRGSFSNAGLFSLLGAVTQSSTTAAGASFSCTNNNFFLTLDGRDTSAPGQQVLIDSQYDNTRVISRIKTNSTNTTASSSGGQLALMTSNTSGTLINGIFINQNQLVVIGATGGTEEHEVNGNLNILAQGVLRLQDTTGGQYVGLRASGTQTTYTITLPASAPGSNTSLSYDGANYVWAAGTGMTNPMTAAGDMIYGGSGGTPLALPVGDEGAILQVIIGTPVWVGGVPSGGGRGLFGGGFTTGGVYQNTIAYITISTTGNATDFGDLTVARSELSSCSSRTRGLWGGGYTGAKSDVIDYVTIATTGNATDFGDLTISGAINGLAANANAIRGIFAGGFDGGAQQYIAYVTIATTGNTTNFGNMVSGRYYFGAVASPIRGIFAANASGGAQLTTEYITMATTGNGTTFGNLSVGRQQLAGAGSNTRAMMGGGDDGARSNVIDYAEFATTGTWTDFGDLTVARSWLAATSNRTRAVWAGGDDATFSNVIDYVTIATTGNATDFGDLTVAPISVAGCSDSHGGL